MKFSGDRRQIPGLFVDLCKQSLDAADLALLEEAFAALSADLGRDCIKREVVTLAVDVERSRSLLHPAATMHTLHDCLLILKPDVHSFGSGK